MQPIENTTGVERAISALLGKTAAVVTATLADKFLGRKRPAKKRRRGRPSARTKRSQHCAARVKGGVRHGQRAT